MKSIIRSVDFQNGFPRIFAFDEPMLGPTGRCRDQDCWWNHAPRDISVQTQHRRSPRCRRRSPTRGKCHLHFTSAKIAALERHLSPNVSLRRREGSSSRVWRLRGRAWRRKVYALSRFGLFGQIPLTQFHSMPPAEAIRKIKKKQLLNAPISRAAWS